VPRYVTTDGVTVRPQTLLPDLIRKMSDSRIDCLVVTDEQERPVGTVSARDILAVIANGSEFSVGDSGDHANELSK
jgi:CBS domain-containing protein